MNEPNNQRKVSPRSGSPLPDPVAAGRVKSERKAAAARINALRTGTQVKHPDTLRALGIGPVEKAAGITLPMRIQQLKEHYRLFGARDRQEFLQGVETMLGDALIDILKKKAAGRDVSKELQSLSNSFMELHDRYYGKLNVNENININVSKQQEEYFKFREAIIWLQQNKPGYENLAGDLVEAMRR